MKTGEFGDDNVDKTGYLTNYEDIDLILINNKQTSLIEPGIKELNFSNSLIIH